MERFGPRRVGRVLLISEHICTFSVRAALLKNRRHANRSRCPKYIKTTIRSLHTSLLKKQRHANRPHPAKYTIIRSPTRHFPVARHKSQPRSFALRSPSAANFIPPISAACDLHLIPRFSLSRPFLSKSDSQFRFLFPRT